MKIQALQVGSIGTNCYILCDEAAKVCAVIDPGAEPELILSAAEKLDCTVDKILLTHGHYDHMMAADELRKAYGISVIAHEKEQEVLEDPRKNLTTMIGMNYTLKADEFVKDGQMLDLAGFSIQVLFTPGHTAGGCCYYIAEYNPDWIKPE